MERRRSSMGIMMSLAFMVEQKKYVRGYTIKTNIVTWMSKWYVEFQIAKDGDDIASPWMLLEGFELREYLRELVDKRFSDATFAAMC